MFDKIELDKMKTTANQAGSNRSDKLLVDQMKKSK